MIIDRRPHSRINVVQFADGPIEVQSTREHVILSTDGWTQNEHARRYCVRLTWREAARIADLVTARNH